MREAGESGAWVGSACAEWRGDERGEVGLNACTYMDTSMPAHTHTHTPPHTQSLFPTLYKSWVYQPDTETQK